MQVIRLYTSYYCDPDPAREKELRTCLLRNSVLGFTSVHLLEGRPTFHAIFSAINEAAAPEDVSVIANSDIYFDAVALKQFALIEKGEAWCLTRYEVRPDGEAQMVEQWHSQDVWVFRGPITLPKFCDFPLGVLGCDNRIALELFESGYRLRNPCQDVRCFHLHNSGIRRREGMATIPGPYRFVRHEGLAE